MTQSLDAQRPARLPDMTGVPVGWYLDPATPGARRYWDGRTWTGQAHASATTTAAGGTPAASTAPRRVSIPALVPQFGALVTTLQALLVAATLMHAASAWTDWRAAGAASRALDKRDLFTVMASHEMDGRALQLGLETLLVTALTAIAFIAWLYLAHHNNRLDRSEVQRDPRWAVGGWFVPVLNFLRPLQVVLDVWHGATGPVKGSPRPAPRSVSVWWGSWLVLVVLGEVALIRSVQGASGAEASMRHAHDLYLLLVTGHAAAVVAGLSAVAVVQQLSAAVRRAPVGGPRG